MPSRDFQTNGAISFPPSKTAIVAIAFFLGGVLLGQASTKVEFTTPEESPTTNTEGVVTLMWKPAEKSEGLTYELQQSATADFSSFKTRYTGPDLGSVLSGLAEGEYHFRVRVAEPQGDWSKPVAIEIKYIERWQVLLLLSVGVTVFVATIATLLAGHLRKSE